MLFYLRYFHEWNFIPIYLLIKICKRLECFEIEPLANPGSASLIESAWSVDGFSLSDWLHFSGARISSWSGVFMLMPDLPFSESKSVSAWSSFVLMPACSDLLWSTGFWSCTFFCVAGMMLIRRLSSVCCLLCPVLILWFV